MKIFVYRQQDEELDELSASVQRIGGVGLTIHEELLHQVKLYSLCIKVFSSASTTIQWQKKSRNYYSAHAFSGVCLIGQNFNATYIGYLFLEHAVHLQCLMLKFHFIFFVFKEKIIDDLGMEMDSTSNRLDFVQVSL